MSRFLRIFFPLLRPKRPAAALSLFCPCSCSSVAPFERNEIAKVIARPRFLFHEIATPLIGLAKLPPLIDRFSSVLYRLRRRGFSWQDAREVSRNVNSPIPCAIERLERSARGSFIRTFRVPSGFCGKEMIVTYVENVNALSYVDNFLTARITYQRE